MLGWLKNLRRHKPLAPGDPEGWGENPDYGPRDRQGEDENPDGRGSRRERARRERARLERARLERAQVALEETAREWSGSEACNRREGWQAKELACQFHRQLQADPDLAGCVVHQVWVEKLPRLLQVAAGGFTATL